jgi:hypothetical protein
MRRLPVLNALPVETEILDVVPADLEHFSGPVWDGQKRIYVIWRNGRPLSSYHPD